MSAAPAKWKCEACRFGAHTECRDPDCECSPCLVPTTIKVGDRRRARKVDDDDPAMLIGLRRAVERGDWHYLNAEHSIQQQPQRLSGHCSVVLQYAVDVDLELLLLAFDSTAAAIRRDLIAQHSERKVDE